MINELCNYIISSIIGATISYVYLSKNNMDKINKDNINEFYDIYFDICQNDINDAILIK